MDGVGADRSAPDLIQTDGRGSGEDEVVVPSSPRQRLFRITVGVLFLAVAAVVLRDKIPSPDVIVAALREANWWWVVGAMTLQVASLGFQIRQQRRLLRAFGVAVSTSRVGAITYSSTAISMSMPVGGAVSAGYTFRQYRSSGASAATAATVLLLSGLASITALVALSVAGVGASELRRLLRIHHQPVWDPVALALVLGGIVELLVLLLRWWGRHQPRPTCGGSRFSVFGERHPRLASILRQVALAGQQAGHLSSHHWRLVLFSSAGNWSLDAACLYASCQAFAIHISVFKLGAVYLGVQLIRQIPITPGGIGVIEASLLAGLIAARAAKGPAAAAVVVYRLFAAWLIVPIGFVTLALLRRVRPKFPRPTETRDTQDHTGASGLTRPIFAFENRIQNGGDHQHDDERENKT